MSKEFFDKNDIVLTAEKVEAGYGDHKVLRGFDLEIHKGEFVGLIGPNGVGKSTFLKCITGIVSITGGDIFINGDNSKRLSQKEKARRVAVVPQSFAIDYEFTVEDIVMMGRNPYFDFRKGESDTDRKIVEDAMRITGTDEYRERYFNELSGGERQRVIVARAIAQGSDILLLDEPTSALDIEHQIELMEMITRENREKGKTVIAVLHDLNMAARYCDRLVMLKDGIVSADGPPIEVITQANLRSIYNMDMIIRNNSIFDRPEVIPIRVLDPEKVKISRRIHVICGSGEAARLLEELTSMGHIVSTGVLNRGADDWIMAHYLGLPMIETEPFSIITPEMQKQNLELMKEAEILLIADVPFGKANVENLKGLENFAGKIYIHSSCFQNDYTPEKEATKLLETLKGRGAAVINDHDEFVELINGTSKSIK